MRRWQTHVFYVNRSQNSSHTRIRPRARKKRPRQRVIVLVISCIWLKNVVHMKPVGWRLAIASELSLLCLFPWLWINLVHWSLFFKVKISFDVTAANCNHFSSWFIPMHLSILTGGIWQMTNRISYLLSFDFTAIWGMKKVCRMHFFSYNNLLETRTDLLLTVVPLWYLFCSSSCSTLAIISLCLTCLLIMLCHQHSIQK